MAQQIKLKRSAVAGRVPTTSSLALGEVAINTADGKLFFQRGDDTIQSFFTTNALITGSLQQSGSDSYFLSNVGIGTDNPQSLLHINSDDSSNAAKFRISTAGGGYGQIQNHNGRTYLGTSTDTQIITLYGDKLGINTQTPTSQLHVTGDSKFVGGTNITGSLDYIRICNN